MITSINRGMGKKIRPLTKFIVRRKLHSSERLKITQFPVTYFYDKTAIFNICGTLHCNEDYAAKCLDSWIETEQIRRSNLHMVPESKKSTKKRVKESTGDMTARIYLDGTVRQEKVSRFIEAMNEYYPEFRIGCPAHAELKISGLNMAQAEDVLEEAPNIGSQVGVRVVKVAFEY